MLLLVVVLHGCGKNDKLSEVNGLVTLDGQPLDDAMIVFSPTSSGTTSYGRSDKDGKFRMLFKDNEYGAWLGENIVRITTFDLPGGGRPGKKERVPVVYNQKSKTVFEVKPGMNEAKFELKSDAGKIIQGPPE
jgi:hypothetical protein